MIKFLKGLFRFIMWLIVITVLSTGIIFFCIPAKYDLTNISINAFVIAILIIAFFFILGMIKGNLKILKIYDRKKLLYRTLLYIVFVIIILGVSGVRTGIKESIEKDKAKQHAKIDEKTVLGKIIYNEYNEGKAQAEKAKKQAEAMDEKKKVREVFLSGLKKTTSNNVEIYYPQEDEDLAQGIIKEIPKLNSNLNPIINVKNPFPLKVVLFKYEGDYKKIVNMPEAGTTVGDYEEGEINIQDIRVLKGRTDIDKSIKDFDEYFYQNFSHEYSHYYLNAYIKENNLKYIFPRWFNEGFAQYMEFKLYDKGLELQPFDGTDEIIPLSNLSQTEQWFKETKSKDKGERAYVESLYAVDYLINSKGKDFIKDIIDSTNKEEVSEAEYQVKFEKNLKDSTGLTVDELQKKAFK